MQVEVSVAHCIIKKSNDAVRRSMNLMNVVAITEQEDPSYNTQHNSVEKHIVSECRHHGQVYNAPLGSIHAIAVDHCVIMHAFVYGGTLAPYIPLSLRRVPKCCPSESTFFVPIDASVSNTVQYLIRLRSGKSKCRFYSTRGKLTVEM